MSEQDKKRSSWAAPFNSLKRELGMLVFIIIAAICCMPFIYAAAWLLDRMPAWLFWLLVISAGLRVLFQETLKAGWQAFRDNRP